MQTASILAVDDEQLQRSTLAGVLKQAGHDVFEASSGESALELLAERTLDLVITDLRMPGLSGLDVVRRVRDRQPDVAVIVLTAYGSVKGAVEALQAGAAHYLTKPVDLEELELVVARVTANQALVRENRVLRRRLEEAGLGDRIIGRSTELREVLARAARAAETDAIVLIRGESGTGKELLARSVHAASARRDGPFVAINCAALPETLLESELFGHEKGAFTGAVKRHVGRVESARGGSLFLDEIGDVSPAVQVKLLRFLQEREFTRVGGEETLEADVRVMAATHRDLEASLQDGSFREDLYYRLNVVSLTLPPLRERREDIPELVERFVARLAKRHDRPVTGVSREAMDRLIKHEFPGNVRELENVLEQATILARGSVITVEDLPANLRDPASRRRPACIRPDSIHGDLPLLLDDLERRVVLETLSRHDGNQSETARHLGLTESGLRYKLKRWRDDA